jgi:hypothetical protein
VYLILLHVNINITFQSRRNGHIKESYSPTVSKENQTCNELLYTKQLTAFHLLENKKQNKTIKRKEGRELSTADKCTSMHVSSSLMNEINTLCNTYKTYRLQIVWRFFVAILYQTETRTYNTLKNLEATSVDSSRLAKNYRRQSFCLSVLCIIHWPSSHRMALTKPRVHPHDQFIEKKNIHRYRRILELILI